MIAESRFDVVIAGGGLAGLCLALQLRQRHEALSVLVVEPNERPLPEAAHKVGESSVESASHYFIETLGLGDLLEDEVRKFGLRFFMSEGDNRDLTTRLECGPSHFLYKPSFQIDRGQFENRLAERTEAAGAVLLAGARVSGVELADGGSAPSGEDHAIEIRRGRQRKRVSARWFVDASGRAAVLRKRLDTGRTSRHRANAAWFRVDAALDVDTFSDSEAWLARNEEPRRLSTNHLIGEGYWVWLIPLAHDRTSVGIVASANLHPFETISSFDRVKDWLDRHEPQLAGVIRDHAAQRMDFRAIKHYGQDIEHVFGAGRWAISGDAGVFIDPLYSPGSDFIGISNTMIGELVARDLAGEPTEDLAETYDQLYRSLTRTFLVTYHRQYAILGNPRAMVLKFVWDFVMYWGGPALIFCRNRIHDPAFMARCRSQLQAFAEANVRMQAFFREWNAARDGDPPLPANTFVDYAELAFLSDLNRSLLESADDEATLEELDRNVALAHALAREISSTVADHNPKLTKPVAGASTNHLAPAFAQLYSGRASDDPR